jgi:hypothetical protein
MKGFRITRLAVVGLAAAAVAAGAVSAASGGSKSQAVPQTGGDRASFTGGIDGRPVQVTGETFYKATLYNVNYRDGAVLLSGDRNGTMEFGVDDALVVKVVHANGSVSTFAHDFSGHCSGGIIPLPPTDISSKFMPGLNRVTVTLKDRCGSIEGSSALWLLP